MKKPSVLTRRDLMARLGVSSVRSVARFEKRYRLQPVNFIGLEPVFDPRDVVAAESRRLTDRRRILARQAAAVLVDATKDEILSVIEAKKRARRGGNGAA